MFNEKYEEPEYTVYIFDEVQELPNMAELTLNSSFSLYGYYLQLKTIAKIIRDNPSAPKTLVKLLDEEIELVKSINEIMRDEKMAGKTLISNESVIQRKAAGVLNKLFGQEKTKHLESN